MPARLAAHAQASRCALQSASVRLFSACGFTDSKEEQGPSSPFESLAQGPKRESKSEPRPQCLPRPSSLFRGARSVLRFSSGCGPGSRTQCFRLMRPSCKPFHSPTRRPAEFRPNQGPSHSAKLLLTYRREPRTVTRLNIARNLLLIAEASFRAPFQAARSPSTFACSCCPRAWRGFGLRIVD